MLFVGVFLPKQFNTAADKQFIQKYRHNYLKYFKNNKMYLEDG